MSFQPGEPDFTIDADIVENLSADIDATLEELAEAAMAAADAVEAWGKRELRADTRAPLGDKVANAWRSRVWPNKGGQASMAPSIGWWSNAPHIVRAFTEGLTIRAGQGKYLAIPTEHAPQTGRTFGNRGRRFATREAERRFKAVTSDGSVVKNTLRYVKVPGKDVLLLVADKVRKRRGKRGGYARPSPTALRKKDYESVVMFVLVPSVTMPRSVDPQAIADAIGREGVARFARAYGEITTRRFGADD